VIDEDSMIEKFGEIMQQRQEELKVVLL